MPSIRPSYGDRRIASVREVRSEEQAHGTATLGGGHSHFSDTSKQRSSWRSQRIGRDRDERRRDSAAPKNVRNRRVSRERLAGRQVKEGTVRLVWAKAFVIGLEMITLDGWQ